MQEVHKEVFCCVHSQNLVDGVGCGQKPVSVMLSQALVHFLVKQDFFEEGCVVSPVLGTNLVWREVDLFYDLPLGDLTLPDHALDKLVVAFLDESLAL